ncbi:MAG: FAD-linked oxidase [Candidatus Cloacimonadota bacterium]|nr:MAG: FAD-linked oxidase [Candidatus Cloacimonadota bacterium]
MYSRKAKIKNWGNYPKVNSNQLFFENEKDVSKINLSIARGLGRSYGDSSLFSTTIEMSKYNYIQSFSEDGVLECTGGLSLEEIINIFSIRGWFLPVTPGTKYVTIGGAIASNVHGKNHHTDGSFSKYVLSFHLFNGNSIIECSRQENRDLFLATFGGMGLTGIIISAKIQLLSIETSYIIQDQKRASNFEELMSYFESSEEEKYSVAWIDCLAIGNELGRGVLITGHHATRDDLYGTTFFDNPLKLHTSLQVKIPIDFPDFILCSESVYLFNYLYYSKPSSETIKGFCKFDPFFYPLDFVSEWNRIYGSTGFVQYQFVIPMKSSREALRVILEKISDKGFASFLAVLKLFGEEDEGFLSFPMRGYTLALDFKIVEGLFDFLEELDQIVLKAGGRLYLAKDARMSKSTFHKSCYDINGFQEVLKKYNCGDYFKSLQSERLGL